MSKRQKRHILNELATYVKLEVPEGDPDGRWLGVALDRADSFSAAGLPTEQDLSSGTRLYLTVLRACRRAKQAMPPPPDNNERFDRQSRIVPYLEGKWASGGRGFSLTNLTDRIVYASLREIAANVAGYPLTNKAGLVVEDLRDLEASGAFRWERGPEQTKRFILPPLPKVVEPKDLETEALTQEEQVLLKRLLAKVQGR